MSTETTTAVATTPDTTKIQTQWGKYGVELSTFKSDRSLKPTAIKAKYPIPTEVSQIDDKVLTQINKEITALKTDRLAKIAPFVKALDKLMEPEKELSAYATEYKAALTKLKFAEQDRIDAENAKAKLMTDLKTAWQKDINFHIAQCKKDINARVLEMYEKTVNSTKVDEISDSIMASMKAKFLGAHFDPFIDVSDGPTDISKLKIQYWQDNFTTAPLVEYAHNQLTHIFTDFTNAKQYPKEAILAAQGELGIAITEIEQTKEFADVGADMGNVAPIVEVEFKPLTDKYELDMEINSTTLALIDKAFLVVDGYNCLTRVKDKLDIKMSQKLNFILDKLNKGEMKGFEGIKVKIVKK